MKKLLILLVAVAALATVPGALAAKRSNPGHGAAKAKVALLKQHARMLARCSKVDATTNPKRAERCAKLAETLPARLEKLDQNLQDRIARITQACPAGSTDRKCDNAAERIDFLQKLDQRLQAVIAKLQAAPATTG